MSGRGKKRKLEEEDEEEGKDGAAYEATSIPFISGDCGPRNRGTAFPPSRGTRQHRPDHEFGWHLCKFRGVEIQPRIRTQSSDTCILSAELAAAEMEIARNVAVAYPGRPNPMVSFNEEHFRCQYEQSQEGISLQERDNSKTSLEIFKKHGVAATSNEWRGFRQLRISGYKTELDFTFCDLEGIIASGRPVLGVIPNAKELASLGPNDIFEFSPVGVLRKSEGSHMVVFIGAGRRNRRSYLVFQNSWGPTFGKNGIGRIYFDQIFRIYFLLRILLPPPQPSDDEPGFPGAGPPDDDDDASGAPEGSKPLTYSIPGYAPSLSCKTGSQISDVKAAKMGEAGHGHGHEGKPIRLSTSTMVCSMVVLKPILVQRLPMKVQNGSCDGEAESITFEDYFKSKQVALPFLQCPDVGKRKCPNYLSIELANLVSLHRRTTLVGKSRQKPQDRMRLVSDIIEHPYGFVDNEDSQARRFAPVVRVDRVFENPRANFPGPSEFWLYVSPERKNCDIYGSWKKKNLHEMDIATQCIVPSNKMNDQYFTNVLLKINAKLGGMDSELTLECRQIIPIVNKLSTLILGMDVSYGSLGRSDVPSIAAVVGYRASVGAQSRKVEVIDSVFKPLNDGNDDGIMRELLLDFYQTSKKRKQSQIIIFRDGVRGLPKITLIVAQKNHHTKLFQADAPDNVPPGTVVDSGIVHSRRYDFYMCAHAGPIVTSRPSHHHVLLENIGFTPDDLQKLVLSLSYVHLRAPLPYLSGCTSSCYVRLAASDVPVHKVRGLCRDFI